MRKERSWVHAGTTGGDLEYRGTWLRRGVVRRTADHRLASGHEVDYSLKERRRVIDHHKVTAMSDRANFYIVDDGKQVVLRVLVAMQVDDALLRLQQIEELAAV